MAELLHLGLLMGGRRFMYCTETGGSCTESHKMYMEVKSLLAILALQLKLGNLLPIEVEDAEVMCQVWEPRQVLEETLALYLIAHRFSSMVLVHGQGHN